MLMDGDRLSNPVAEYYRATRMAYRVAWSSRHLHYGWCRLDGARQSHREQLDAMVEALAEMGGIAAGERVLDAGCGVGGSSVWLSERRGAHVIGLTIMSDQVAQAHASARRRLGPGYARRLDFVRGDYTSTPFPDAYFDVVWALESACHARSKSAFLREAYRVLRPGGRLVLGDGFRARRPLADERLFRRVMAGWQVPDLLTCEELMDAARDAGFVGIDGRDITPHVLPSARRMARVAAAMGWVSVFGSAENRGNAWSARHQAELFDRGLARYVLWRARKPQAHPGAPVAERPARW
jgi:SAM-dependent methyltransferase